jgi:hypothetical protein
VCIGLVSQARSRPAGNFNTHARSIAEPLGPTVPMAQNPSGPLAMENIVLGRLTEAEPGFDDANHAGSIKGDGVEIDRLAASGPQCRANWILQGAMTAV